MTVILHEDFETAGLLAGQSPGTGITWANTYDETEDVEDVVVSGGRVGGTHVVGGYVESFPSPSAGPGFVVTCVVRGLPTMPSEGRLLVTLAEDGYDNRTTVEFVFGSWGVALYASTGYGTNEHNLSLPSTPYPSDAADVELKFTFDGSSLVFDVDGVEAGVLSGITGVASPFEVVGFFVNGLWLHDIKVEDYGGAPPSSTHETGSLATTQFGIPLVISIHQVASFTPTAFGVPSLPGATHTAIVQPIALPVFGNISAAHVAKTPGINSTQFGTPTTPFNWIAEVQPLMLPNFGRPYGVGEGAIRENIVVQATSWRTTVISKPTANGSLFALAQPLPLPQFGQPKAVGVCAAATMGALAQFGQHRVTSMAKMAPWAHSTVFSTPVTGRVAAQNVSLQAPRFGKPVASCPNAHAVRASLPLPRFGKPTAYSQMDPHRVTAGSATQFGTPYALSLCKARSLAPTLRFGRHTMKRNPPC